MTKPRVIGTAVDGVDRNSPANSSTSWPEAPHPRRRSFCCSYVLKCDAGNWSSSKNVWRSRRASGRPHQVSSGSVRFPLWLLSGCLRHGFSRSFRIDGESDFNLNLRFPVLACLLNDSCLASSAVWCESADRRHRPSSMFHLFSTQLIVLHLFPSLSANPSIHFLQFLLFSVSFSPTPLRLSRPYSGRPACPRSG